MIKAAFCLHPDAYARAYDDMVRARLAQSVEIVSGCIPTREWPERRELLSGVEVLFSGWGPPRLDEAFLEAVPNLRAVFYAAGDHRYFATDAFWERGIRLSTANALNAVPVSEYTVAAIVLGLKRFWHFARQPREVRKLTLDRWVPGNYRSTVALISYGTIARLVRRKLATYDLDVLVYDPFLSDEAARLENVTKVSLADAFHRADAISVHTPSLPETRSLIRCEHFAALRPGAVFINTARGDIVDEDALIAVLAQRDDVQAILDVTREEPPREGSPLYRLSNVVFTPHIAGSLAGECVRLGLGMVDECERFLAGRPLKGEVIAPVHLSTRNKSTGGTR
jgi:phosphoglycerate dehydrogenase-like enzyme